MNVLLFCGKKLLSCFWSLSNGRLMVPLRDWLLKLRLATHQDPPRILKPGIFIQMALREELASSSNLNFLLLGLNLESLVVKLEVGHSA